MQKYILFISIITMFILAAFGCQPTKSTSSDIKLWPILDAQSSVMVNEDGSWSEKEKGDAVLLAHWKNSKSFNSQGKIIQREDNLEVWPLFDCHFRESDNNKKANGTILIFFNYDTSESK